MKVGPRYKIAKRLGANVFEKTQTQKFQLSEERSARSKRRGGRPRALSNYGRQLLEKQRVRYTYGITERQLARYAAEARTGALVNPATTLFQTLEHRLDNVVYRLGLARTRRLARQMVSHGHITLNGRKTTIPSAQAHEGDAIAVREGSRSSGLFAELSERLSDYRTPSWLRFDEKKFEGSVSGKAQWEPSDAFFDLNEVLEFYSK